MVHFRGPHAGSAHTVKTSLSILVCLLFSALSTTKAPLLEWVFSASSPAGSPCCPLSAQHRLALAVAADNGSLPARGIAGRKMGWS